MTCPHCAQTSAELAELRAAIGVAETRGAIPALRDAFGLSPTVARLVLKLYSAAGRPVEKHALDSLLSVGVGSKTLKVHIWRIRQDIGADCIETVPGYGYRLSKAGLDLIFQAVSPQVAA